MSDTARNCRRPGGLASLPVHAARSSRTDLRLAGQGPGAFLSSPGTPRWLGGLELLAALPGLPPASPLKPTPCWPQIDNPEAVPSCADDWRERIKHSRVGADRIRRTS